MCTLWWPVVSKDVPRINTIAAMGVGRASKLCHFDFCLNRGIWSISSRAVPNSPTNIARTCYMNGWHPNPHCQLGWVWAEWLESVLLERRWHHHSARHHPLDNQVACGCWFFLLLLLRLLLLPLLLLHAWNMCEGLPNKGNNAIHKAHPKETTIWEAGSMVLSMKATKWQPSSGAGP